MRRKTEEWGDEKAERDATAAIEESRTDSHDGRGEQARTLWYFIRRSGRRIAVAIGGFALIFVGILMLVFPGPGWVAIFAGLALLATEFVWAERMLGRAKRVAEKGMDIALGPADERSWPAVIGFCAVLAAAGLSLASAILGFEDTLAIMVAWISVGLAIFGIVLGHIALIKIKRSPKKHLHGRWLAFGALLLGYPSAVLLVGLLLPLIRS